MKIKKNFCSIITVNYNAFSFTKNLLDNFSYLDTRKFNLFIVDNFSNDNSFKEILEYLDINLNENLDLNDSRIISTYKKKHIYLIKLDSNYGYAAAINIPLNYIKNNYFESLYWVINNDIEIEKNTLNILIKEYEQNTIVTPMVYDLNNKNEIQSLGCTINPYFLTTNNITSVSNLNNTEIDYLSGVSLFFDYNVLNNVGYLSESYFMYYEDVDWSERARNKKIKLVVNLNTKIFHNDKKFILFKLKFLSIYNRLKFSIKFHKNRILLVFIYTLLSSLYNLFKYLFILKSAK